MVMTVIPLMLVGLAVGATISTSLASSLCAPQCSCVQNIMSCAGKGLTALPSGHWPSVIFLDVSSNAIDNIDDLGRRFPSLNALRMRHNALTALDLNAVAGPSAPNRLMMADLTGNRITQVLPLLPNTGVNLITTLFLSSNLITSLERETFTALPNLRQLALNDNPLVIPPAQPFLSHNVLNELGLSDVDARALSEHTFAELPRLVVVNLERSGVENVNGIFKNLLAVDTLYLESNAITEIVSDNSKISRSLRVLSLNGNPLVRADTEALPVGDGGELSIADTPLSCSCAHGEVAAWASEHRVKLLATCHAAPLCHMNGMAA